MHLAFWIHPIFEKVSELYCSVLAPKYEKNTKNLLRIPSYIPKKGFVNRKYYLKDMYTYI